VIYLRNISVYGISVGCATGGGTNLKFMTVSFDSSLNWNTGTDDPTTNEVDAQHVITHELGHFSGFAGGVIEHFSSSVDCDRSPPIDYGS